MTLSLQNKIQLLVMHFLCLHGFGTNSQVLETQLSAIRYELGDEHTYDYVDGTVSAIIAPEIETIFPKSDEYFTYFNDLASSKKALENLRSFIKTEGPFDGIIAFCNGSLLAATMLIRDSKLGILDPNLKVAVLFSSPMLGDRTLSIGEEEGTLIHLPTAHIWGINDKFCSDAPGMIADLCARDVRNIFVHDGGHEIPGVKNKESVTSAVHAIQRAIDAAL